MDLTVHFFSMFCQSSSELIPFFFFFSFSPTWGMQNRTPQIRYKIPGCSCRVAARIYSPVYFWVLWASCLYYLFTVYNTLTFSLGIEEYACIIYTFWFCQMVDVTLHAFSALDNPLLSAVPRVKNRRAWSTPPGLWLGMKWASLLPVLILCPGGAGQGWAAVTVLRQSSAFVPPIHSEVKPWDLGMLAQWELPAVDQEKCHQQWLHVAIPVTQGTRLLPGIGIWSVIFVC